jgi:hypothetical protein
MFPVDIDILDEIKDSGLDALIKDNCIIININGYDLEQTCSLCPEQYEVFKGGKRCGYIRLRHGNFRVDYPDCMEETLLLVDSIASDGMFEADERPDYLRRAIQAIDERRNLTPILKFDKYVRRKHKSFRDSIKYFFIRRKLKKMRKSQK